MKTNQWEEMEMRKQEVFEKKYIVKMKAWSGEQAKADQRLRSLSSLPKRYSIPILPACGGYEFSDW